MYKLIKQGNSYNDSTHFYICDTLADLQLIPLPKLVKDSIGDKAYIINTSEKYVRNSKGQWVEDLSDIRGVDGDTIFEARLIIHSFE